MNQFFLRNFSPFLKNFSPFLILLGCVFFVQAAGAITVEQLQQKMQEHDAAIHSLEFTFVQRVRSSLDSQTKESAGSAFIVKPKQVRIDQLRPEKQLVIGSGKTVYIYTPRFNQVLKSSWDKWVSNNFAFPGLSGFSQTLQKMKENYVWEIVSEPSSETGSETSGETRLIEVLLKNGTKETLHLWVDPTDFVPRKTEFIYGTLTLTTRLENVKINEPVDANLFQFKKPKNVTVLAIP